MKIAPRSLRLLPLALLLVAGPSPAQQAPAVTLAPPTPASTDGPVGLTPAQASSFKAALDALAQQGHTCLVAEAAPLHPTLAPKDAPAVPAHTPLDAAVTLVAGAYDYDVKRTGNVFVLTKKYTDPADLPELTLEECAEGLNSAALALEAFDPPAVWSGRGVDPIRDRVAAILGGLTPDERQAVFSKGGLPVAALDGDARAAVDQWNLGMYLDAPATSARGYQGEATRATQASVGTSTIDLTDVGTGHMNFGVKTAFGRREPGGGGGTFFAPFNPGIAAIKGAGYDGSGGPLTSADLVAARARAAAWKDGGCETLAQAVATQGARGTRCAVAAALAAKRVTVDGEANAPPGAVLRALAQVYGLRARLRESDGVLVVDLPERLTPVDVAAVRGDVLAMLPAPLLRASHLLDLNTSQEKMDENMQRLQNLIRQGSQGSAAYAALLVERQRLREREKNQGDMLPAVDLAAVRALRVAVELYPASAKVGGLLSVTAMTPQDRAAYATAVMIPFLARMTTLITPTPLKYVTEEDQYVLTAEVYAKPDARGTWKVDLILNKPQPSGRLDLAVGVMDVAYVGTPPDAPLSTDPAPPLSP